MHDVTLSEWWTMLEDERAVVLDQLLERMPAGYLDLRTTGIAAGPLPQFVHQPSGVLFHVVFGGKAVLGMTEARRARLEALAPADREFQAAVKACTPTRETEVETCLVADEVLRYGTFKKLGLTDDEASIDTIDLRALPEALDGLEDWGWRAPSESEWEYACRAVEDEPGEAPLEGTARLAGLQLLYMGARLELCRDDWFGDLTGYPARGSRGEGHEVVRGRGRSAAFFLGLHSPAFSEAVLPSRMRAPRRVSLRPWVSLLK